MAPTPQLLANKVAIVTGADSDIGKAIATKMHANSCKTLAEEINRNKPEDATGKAEAMDCEDVSNWDSFSRVIEEVLTGETTKNLDIFYYHAEFFNRVFGSSGTFNHSMEDNVKYVLDFVGNVMGKNDNKKGGCILYASSAMRMLGDAMPSAYRISQTAAIGVVRSKAAELAGQKVRVNAISQGILDWRVLRSIFPRASDRQLKQMRDNWMMTKAETIEVANTAVFLASDYGKSVTGHNLLLNGSRL
ncbi:unnamed protein product [Urochloa decumbens]|uniref:Uncharacterized protein n=1 Tax=Urochloa decumbens TaxID=240449 RepID=A0ABC9AZ67_9POAL